MLEFIGWKDYRGRWDKHEIMLDVLIGLLIGLSYAVYSM